MSHKVWAIIPGYNEEKHIGNVINEVLESVDGVIVVDDGSEDRTTDVAVETGNAIVLRHIVNLGKGAALKTGADYAISAGADRMIFIDADGQHDPAKIPEFLNGLEDNDIVFGYREFSGDMPFVLRFGNWFINTVTAILYGIRLKDTQSGYRGLTSDAYEKVRWLATDYFVETEMIANAGRKKLKYKEIPIKTIYADKYKGTTVIDGVKIVLNLIFRRIVK